MKKRISRILIIVLAVKIFISAFSLGIYAEPNLAGEAKSVILIEANTGRVLYESDADLRLAPASVTKIMTILLVAEEIDRGTIKLTDIVQVSENASKMGGSQVYLEAGEQMSVDDLLKSVVIASANDAATALAETVAGSVEGFVEKMNTRAAELKMTNTHFENPTGLDDSTVDHKTTARDISLMSRELLRHSLIFNYSTVWMDSIRNGEFGLTNTNRLIRFYSGANGLKTGSTSKAGFCISATAKRDGMQLIAVIMGAPNRDIRNEIAKKLLDYGFANYKYLCKEECELEPIRVLGGVSDTCRLTCRGFDIVLDRSDAVNGLTPVYDLPESISAPVEIGDVIGTVDYQVNGKSVGTADIIASEKIDKISFGKYFKRMLAKVFLCG